MTLKADSGLVKSVAFVSVEDYGLVGSGKTTEAALRNYSQALRGRGNSIAIGDVENYQNIEGSVVRFRQETIDQTVTYYVLLAGAPDRLFAIPSDLAPMVRMTEIGDQLSLAYQEDSASVVNVLEFENKTLSLRRSETQIEIDEQIEGSQGEP